MSHGQVDHRFAAVGQHFVVLAPTTITTEPAKGSLDHPPFGQNLKAGHIVAAFDDLQDPVPQLPGPLDPCAGVSPIGLNQLKPRELPGQLGQPQLGPVAVLDVGRVDDDYNLPLLGTSG